MYLMIDNYDSFVYNLACYFRECHAKVDLVRNDRITLEGIERQLHNLDGIILSPGPKSPSDCGICKEIVERFQNRIPILGVCLGHQIIGAVYGANIQKGRTPVHGKVHEIVNSQTGLFSGLPESYFVTRYHSLVVDRETLPSTLSVDAHTADGVIMAMHHRQYPVYGVQFHPEAVLTEYGHPLIQNFMHICKKWRDSHEN